MVLLPPLNSLVYAYVWRTFGIRPYGFIGVRFWRTSPLILKGRTPKTYTKVCHFGEVFEFLEKIFSLVYAAEMEASDEN
jgi:hypothetical protein